MIIKRDRYLNQLIRKMGNGQIKIITGVRRCGKSFLLFELFRSYLRSQGVEDGQIIGLSLEDDVNARYRNPMELSAYVRAKAAEPGRRYFVFLDEIQNVGEIPNPWLEGEDRIGFVDVLLGLMKVENLDIYVTGSNSRMLSSDVVTAFRDRGDEVRLYPLSYQEYRSAYNGGDEEAWRDYCTYGGLPRVLALADHKEKADYLQNLFVNTYKRDVLERYQIKNDKDVLDDLMNVLASSVGSLTNPNKLANTFKTVKGRKINATTLDAYLGYLVEAFLLDRAYRYDIKGKRYIGTPLKYYFTDLGLRNAHLNFRQLEENHIMENIIFNELKLRGYSVDVGVVERRTRNGDGVEVRAQLEVDFVAGSGGKTYYVQSALNIDDEAKRLQETESLRRIPDSSKKIVVVKDHITPWNDDSGIAYIGVRDFLMRDDSLDL